MISLEREILDLRDGGVITPDRAAPLIAEERREIVSLYVEIRVVAWLGAMAVAAGVGVIVSKNIDRIGPIAIAVGIGAASLSRS